MPLPKCLPENLYPDCSTVFSSSQCSMDYTVQNIVLNFFYDYHILQLFQKNSPLGR